MQPFSASGEDCLLSFPDFVIVLHSLDDVCLQTMEHSYEAQHLFALGFNLLWLQGYRHR